jgi:nitroreductase
MVELLRARRSVRLFDPRPIAPDVLQLLTEALLRSPSSRAINPWEFIFVNDVALINELSKAKQHGASFLKGASLAVVIAGDERRSDVWVEDCSIASIILQLAAQSLGLGSCWIQIRNRPHNTTCSAESWVQQLLTIPPQLRVESIVALGYPAENPPPLPRDALDEGKIHYNRYQER